jgi:hypothetical protein
MSEKDIRDLQVLRSLLVATQGLAKSLMYDGRLNALECNLKALSLVLDNAIFYRMLYEACDALKRAFASMVHVAALAENLGCLVGRVGDIVELSGHDVRALVESLQSIERHMNGLGNVSRILKDMADFLSSEMEGLEDPDFFSRVVETSENHMAYSEHLFSDDGYDDIYLDLSDEVYLGDLSDFEVDDDSVDTEEDMEGYDDGDYGEAE